MKTGEEGALEILLHRSFHGCHPGSVCILRRVVWSPMGKSHSRGIRKGSSKGDKAAASKEIQGEICKEKRAWRGARKGQTPKKCRKPGAAGVAPGPGGEAQGDTGCPGTLGKPQGSPGSLVVLRPPDLSQSEGGDSPRVREP